MPAIDRCEPIVIRAFLKDQWRVIEQPYAIRIIGRPKRKEYLYADLRLKRLNDNRSIIIVEVKCFGQLARMLDDFYEAVGQYIVYRNAIKISGEDTLVYLTVPLAIYETFFSYRLSKQLFKISNLRWLS